MMGYEDDRSRLVYRQIKQDDCEARDFYRAEVMDMLDKLIESSTKMPTFNDLAH
jgi:hypothetical protein